LCGGSVLIGKIEGTEFGFVEGLELSDSFLSSIIGGRLDNTAFGSKEGSVVAILVSVLTDSTTDEMLVCFWVGFCDNKSTELFVTIVWCTIGKIGFFVGEAFAIFVGRDVGSGFGVGKTSRSGASLVGGNDI